jgi:putative nucleotidyltransferase with HDIG domain
MPEQYMSIALASLQVGEPLPVPVYLYLDFRFITFRAQGDKIDRNAFDRLEFKKVKDLFVNEKDRAVYEAWIAEREKVDAKNLAPPTHEQKGLDKARDDAHRKTMDIFQSQHTDKAVAQALVTSKKLVSEVMKFPYAVQSLAQLQNYSKGTVDHSVNVSVLSTYLAMQMGYSHQLILQHVGMGGLLHDLGKPKCKVQDGDSDSVVETKLKEHAQLGAKALESMSRVPNEVKLIVAQHHEAHDGNGYPKKMRGAQIYDLARIVSIANVFDELVGDGQGALVDRQRSAIQQLDQILFKKFDPQKLEKALRILKLGV